MIGEIKRQVLFIRRCNEVHNGKYKYDYVHYVNNRTKVRITCVKHGDFYQNPRQHLRGQGCPLCAKERTSPNKGIKNNVKPIGRRYTNDEFIEILKSRLGDEYDLSKVSYETRNSMITIGCRKHGYYIRTATALMHNNPICPVCRKEQNQHALSLGRENFIKKVNEVFHGMYSYDNVEYVNNSTKVKITCNKHGDFECTPQNHMHGRGCPLCKEESYVYENRLYNFLTTFLDESEITRQYRPIWLTNNKSLDFYLPRYNIAIEHQGSQHYLLTRYNGDNDEKLLRRIKNDEDKLIECSQNGVKLLHFTYEMKKAPTNCKHELIFNETELMDKIKSIIDKTK